jgi:hypothetical protein
MAVEILIKSIEFESEKITCMQEAIDKTLEIDGPPDFFIY